MAGSYSDRTVLGLPPTGPLRIDAVKTAFRSSALKWHPDKHQGPSQAMKDMFPRMSNSELMAPVDNVVSTEKLRQCLVEGGVSEAVFQDSEQIVKCEFSALQNQLMLLKQKQSLLIDTLRHLEITEVRDFAGEAIEGCFLPVPLYHIS